MTTDRRFYIRIYRLVLLMSLILLTACGTLEIGLEPEREPGTDQTNTPQLTMTPEIVEDLPSPTRPAPITPTPSESSDDLGEMSSEGNEVTVEAATIVPTPVPEKPMLRIAYVKENNVWLWTEENGGVALTKNGGVETVLLSDDGLHIAFRRGGNIWAVNSDGSGERQLTTEIDFEGISFGEDRDPYVIEVTPYKMAWRPGTHTLFFNTVPQLEGPGLMLTDDLWAADVDTGELTALLPRGEGGEFTISPDGRTIALSTPGVISLFDTTSHEKRQVFTYTPVLTYSEFQYYAQPAWAADSKTLAVAIPPADRMASADQLTSIWTIPVEGTAARLDGHIGGTAGLQAEPLFSPDLSHVIYLTGDSQGGPLASEIAISEITQDDTREVVELRNYPFQAEVLNSWSPDGQHFVFTPPYDGTAPRRQIVTLEGETIDVGEAGMAVFQITWIDETRYLYLQSNARGWTLFLEQLAGDTFVVIDAVVGGPPSFDFDV